MKEVDKDDTHLDEIIPENVTEEIETHSDVERSLLKILRLWGGLTENVPLGDKWKGGTELRRSFVPRSFSLSYARNLRPNYVRLSLAFAPLGYTAIG